MANWQLDTIDLPGDLPWTDEFRWTSVRQRRSNSITGALLLHQSTVLAGRPITLGQDPEVWISRQTVIDLLALVETQPESMTLTHPDGRTFTVKFRVDDTPVEAEPVVFQSPAIASDPYIVTIRLIEL